jgi:hypothetical protein
MSESELNKKAHSFHHFGDQAERRCNNCSQLESKATEYCHARESLLEDVSMLRQKLEAAEAELKDVLLDIGEIRSALNIPHDVTAVDGVKAAATAIREAQEQKPFEWQLLDRSFSTREVAVAQRWTDRNLPLVALYAAPVPAMPIQDDNWVTITSEEWNIPNLGQRVIVCIDGVVQNESFTLDMADSDMGIGSYYWDHPYLDDCPLVKSGDSWMPWPKKN